MYFILVSRLPGDEWQGLQVDLDGFSYPSRFHSCLAVGTCSRFNSGLAVVHQKPANYSSNYMPEGERGCNGRPTARLQCMYSSTVLVHNDPSMIRHGDTYSSIDWRVCMQAHCKHYVMHITYFGWTG